MTLPVFRQEFERIFDGIVVLVKPSLSLISDKTNANRAFGTTGLAYGLGTSINRRFLAFSVHFRIRRMRKVSGVVREVPVRVIVVLDNHRGGTGIYLRSFV